MEKKVQIANLVVSVLVLVLFGALTLKGDSNLGTNFTLNRKNWNFGGSTPGMSDNVNVSILVNLEKK